jgi:hypothetical protein
MSTKVSRMVADRLAIANTVTSSIQIHGPEVAPALEKKLFPAGAPNGFSGQGMLTALSGLLGRKTDALVTADRAHATELADDDAFRTSREERRVELSGYLSSLRESLSRNYGPAVAAAYGLPSALPDDAQGLLSLAGIVEALLRKRALTEKPKRKSLAVDPIAAADDLKAAAGDLEATLTDVEREKREAQITLNAKNEAMAEWGTTYQGVADAAAALYVLAGRPDLAERVRPTARRRAGLPEADDLPAVEEKPAEEKPAEPVPT